MKEDLSEFEEKGIISPERMRAVDRNAAHLGIEGLRLMEAAGVRLAAAVMRYSHGRVLVLCGGGNNGGDGFVAARHLCRDVEVHVVYPDGRVKAPSALENLKLLPACDVSLHPVTCREDVAGLSRLFEEADVIVDAILGTGAKGTPGEPYASIIALASSSSAKIVSADLPTPGITPDVICAFHRPKVEGSETAGIGIPLEAEIFTGPGDLLMLPSKDPKAHKGAGGRVLVIGGGPYQGAPYLAGMAALRAGADIVRIASPVFMPCPDLIVEELEGPCVSMEHLDTIARLAGEADAVVCGCGLGTRSHDVVTAALPSMKKAVFDADSLRTPLPTVQECILTPHAGELERLGGPSVSGGLYDRAKALRKFAAGLEGSPTILLKGKTDIITDGERIRFNRTGHPGMTVGGTGDVLAGICGALLCRIPPFDAACIASYVNGCAGESVGLEAGDGMTATDLLSGIPGAMRGDIDR